MGKHKIVQASEISKVNWAFKSYYVDEPWVHVMLVDNFLISFVWDNRIVLLIKEVPSEVVDYWQRNIISQVPQAEDNGVGLVNASEELIKYLKQDTPEIFDKMTRVVQAMLKP